MAHLFGDKQATTDSIRPPSISLKASRAAAQQTGLLLDGPDHGVMAVSGDLHSGAGVEINEAIAIHTPDL